MLICPVISVPGPPQCPTLTDVHPPAPSMNMLGVFLGLRPQLVFLSLLHLQQPTGRRLTINLCRLQDTVMNCVCAGSASLWRSGHVHAVMLNLLVLLFLSCGGTRFQSKVELHKCPMLHFLSTSNVILEINLMKLFSCWSGNFTAAGITSCQGPGRVFGLDHI